MSNDEKDLLKEMGRALAMVLVAGCISFGLKLGFVWLYDMPDRQAQKVKIEQRKKKQYNAMDVVKYSNDTIEFVFDKKTNYKNKFERMYYNNADSYQDKLLLFGKRGDTLQVRFLDKKLQRKFEKEWEKYNNAKLVSAAQVKTNRSR